MATNLRGTRPSLITSYGDELRLFRRIATMDSSAPLPTLDDQRPTWDKAAALAREWELKQLASRLGELAAASS